MGILSYTSHARNRKCNIHSGSRSDAESASTASRLKVVIVVIALVVLAN
jgi:hypothetical protein